MTFKKIHEPSQEESSQRYVLNQNISYCRNPDVNIPQMYPIYQSGVRRTTRSCVHALECTTAQLGVAQACTTANGLLSFDHLAIIGDLFEVNHSVAPGGREYDYQRFSIAPSTMSQEHLLSIIEDALSLINKTI
eukprot:CAMPEP_0170441884 /NCGR_PEP_ID=MMETSP0117_2-20130122/47129_1 /TAXON_ID=400756 /ORGANISM="Durinskia baltica, Strain CSIRO CS-38" /LENGTH=133 /DNA_ID=CAMNT_0010702449 /DNA_START=38 /DNA_END=439 /DNA_ORIENTATION=-